jgi:hypothetical protein
MQPGRGVILLTSVAVVPSTLAVDPSAARSTLNLCTLIPEPPSKTESARPLERRTTSAPNQSPRNGTSPREQWEAPTSGLLASTNVPKV